MADINKTESKSKSELHKRIASTQGRTKKGRFGYKARVKECHQ
jgi:hypothetical protein